MMLTILLCECKLHLVVRTVRDKVLAKDIYHNTQITFKPSSVVLRDVNIDNYFLGNKIM